MSKFYKQYVCPYDKHYSLIIEDDGRVSYAYLLKDRDIISDVWLYNQQESPDNTNWTNRDEMPFLNPKEYLYEGKSIPPIESDSDVKLDWKYGDELYVVNVFIREERIAVLKPDLRPGFSIMVREDGPLAKKWDV
jgi:hypothetical protein